MHSPSCAPSDRFRRPFAGKIDRNHPAAGGAQNLNRQNAYQAYPDHCYRFPEGDVCLAHALHRDRANRGQRRRLQAHVIGDADGEVAGTKLTSEWLA